jgi:hypothetical protein
MAIYAVRDAVGRLENIQSLATQWINGLKIHAAALPLAEFTGTIGNLAALVSAAIGPGERWPASEHWICFAIRRFRCS